MALTYKVNHVGEKFNKLTILDFYPKEGHNQYWKCKCECGNETIVSIAHLRTGHTKTCGKCKWVGRVFGKLTVIEETNKRTNDQHIIVKCKCECGNIIERGVDTLCSSSSIMQSCGCQSRSSGELKIHDILESHNISFKEEYTFKDLKSEKNRPLRFDFCVFDENGDIDFLIEYDGEQHFQDKNLERLKDLQHRDQMKNEYCKKNNIKLIRIPYTDKAKIDYDYIIKAAYN